MFISGGVENMTRGPYVMAKPSTAFGGDSRMYDSTFGWRFVNQKMHKLELQDPLYSQKSP